MFYEEDSIDKSLKCPICAKRFQDPISLPCGEIVCQTCINDFIEEKSDQSNNNNEFKCFACEEEHSIPEKGFPKSKRMNDLAQVKSKQVYKSTQLENFKADVNECLSEINRIKQELENKEETIRDYFELKRHQIHQVAESKIDEINKIARALLDQVDQFENENLESFKNHDKEEKLKADLKEAEVFCKQWLERLKLPETNDNDVEQERDKFNDRFKSVQKYNFIASDFIFNSQQIHFVENQDAIESSAVGKFEITSHRLENVSVQEISAIRRNLKLHKTFLLDVNQFDNGNMCTTKANYYFLKKSDHLGDRDQFLFLFSLLNASGDEKIKFQSNYCFSKNQLDNASVISFSNGTHVLVSVSINAMCHYLFILANDKQTKHELFFLTKRELKISLDSQNVYVLGANESAIDVYDFTLQKIKSIQIGEQFQHLLDPSLPIMINDDSLYAYNNRKVDTYQLSNFKLTKSFNVNFNDSPLSMHFAKGYFILRYDDHLKYVDLNDGRTVHRAVTDVDWSGEDWKMTVYGINRFIFFNHQTGAVQMAT